MVSLSEKSLEDALCDIESSKLLSVKPTRMLIPWHLARYIEENNIDVDAIVRGAQEKLHNG